MRMPVLASLLLATLPALADIPADARIGLARATIGTDHPGYQQAKHASHGKPAPHDVLSPSHGKPAPYPAQDWLLLAAGLGMAALGKPRYRDS